MSAFPPIADIRHACHRGATEGEPNASPALASVLALAAPAAAQPARQPIIDMHLHADAADAYGPPPLAMCTPFEEIPTWNQRQAYPDQFLHQFKNPTCPNPVWSPTRDELVMQQTVAAMERRNIYGVLSGTPERVASWRKAAPSRFWSGLGFRLARGYSVARVSELHRNRQLDVLAEVTTAYEGIEPDDPRLEPYCAPCRAPRHTCGSPRRPWSIRSDLPWGRGLPSQVAQSAQR